MASQLLLHVAADFTGALGDLELAAARLPKLGAAAGRIGENLSKLTAPLLALGALVLKSGRDQELALATIIRQTGATGAALEPLIAAYEQVRRETEADAGIAANAVGDLNTRLGVAGRELGDLTTQMINLAGLHDTELMPLITSMVNAMRAWGVPTERMGAMLDGLHTAARRTGIGIQPLFDELTAAAPLFQFVGIGVEGAALLLGELNRVGLDTEAVMASVKIFLNKGGNLDEFWATIRAIKAAPTIDAAAAIAIQKFGKQGFAMAQAIRAGALDIDRLRKSYGGATESINAADDAADSLADKIQVLANQVELALRPLGRDLMVVISRAAVWMEWAVRQLADAVAWFGALPGPVKGAALAVAGLAAVLGPVLFVVGVAVSAWAKLTRNVVALRKATASVVKSAGRVVRVSRRLIRRAGRASSWFRAIGGVMARMASVIGWMGRALAVLVTGPAAPFIAVGAALVAVAMNWERLVKWTKPVVTWLSDAFETVWGAIKQAHLAVMEWLLEALQAGLKAVLRIFALAIKRLVFGLSIGTVSDVYAAAIKHYRTIAEAFARLGRANLALSLGSVVDLVADIRELVIAIAAKLKDGFEFLFEFFFTKLQDILLAVYDVYSIAILQQTLLDYRAATTTAGQDAAVWQRVHSVRTAIVRLSGRRLSVQIDGTEVGHAQLIGGGGFELTQEIFDLIMGILGAAGWLYLVPDQYAFEVPQVILALASGGIVSAPTLAIVGEAGPEAIVSLDEMEPRELTINIPGLIVTGDDLVAAVGREYGLFVAAGAVA